MVRAAGQIALEEVIRPDPQRKEFAEKPFENAGIVVDPSEEDGLASQGDSRIGEAAYGGSDLGGKLFWMVKMKIQVERPKPTEESHQAGGDPLGEHAWNPRPDPEDPNMGDPPEFGEDPAETGIGEHQGITARNQHVLDRGMRRDVVDPGTDRRIGHGADPADLPLSGTKPTINGAFQGHQEEDPVRIPVGEMGDRAVFFLAKGVFETHGVLEFPRIGNDLTGQARPLGLDHLPEIPVDPEGINPRHPSEGLFFGLGERELVYLVDALPKQALPRRWIKRKRKFHSALRPPDRGKRPPHGPRYP